MIIAITAAHVDCLLYRIQLRRHPEREPGLREYRAKQNNAIEHLVCTLAPVVLSET